MRLFESVRVAVRKGQVPTLLLARPLLLEMLLRHHVQVGICRQVCVRWRFRSCLLPDRIGSALRRRSAISRALSVEHRHRTNNECRCYHHHKKAHRFKFSGHA
jgi:hypothetical protein